MSFQIEGIYDNEKLPPVYVGLREGIPFGTPEFADEVYEVVKTGNASARFQWAVLVRRALEREALGKAVVDWPIYNLRMVGANLLGLSLLPSFNQPARAILFSRTAPGQSLRVLEVILLSRPELSAIPPGWFVSQYAIEKEDHLGYRSAVIKILKLAVRSC